MVLFNLFQGEYFCSIFFKKDIFVKYFFKENIFVQICSKGIFWRKKSYCSCAL